ncbi:MAG: hypothetical protein RL217_1440, partial [Pseudomonadota bacterium]
AVFVSSKQQHELTATRIKQAEVQKSTGPASQGVALSLSRETQERLALQTRSQVQSLDSTSAFAHAELAQNLTASLTQAKISLRDWQGNLQESREGIMLEISSISEIKRSEGLHFEALGQAQTSDGRRIDFMLSLDLSREVREEQSLYFKGQVQRIDPLMLNMKGGMVELTDQWFDFDLLGDGSNLGLLKTAQGSGYLAFDQNGNGQIDNGKELFGPSTQNGFAELRAYDDDGNGWIDENDSIFSQLGLFSFDEQGQARFTSAKDASLGALYLGAAQSQYELIHASGQNLGTLVNNGLALAENGHVLMLQEVHLRMESRQASNTNLVINGVAIAAAGDATALIHSKTFAALNVAAAPNPGRSFTLSAVDVRAELKTSATTIGSWRLGTQLSEPAREEVDPKIQNLRDVIARLRQMREAQQLSSLKPTQIYQQMKRL